MPIIDKSLLFVLLLLGNFLANRNQLRDALVKYLARLETDRNNAISVHYYYHHHRRDHHDHDHDTRIAIII